MLGDSHALVFTSKQFKTYFPNHFFNVLYVGGATVSGLQNPNSRTQALPIFRQTLENSRAETTIIILGEVDTGFVIWHRAEKHQTQVEVTLDTAIENYQSLLTTISKKSRVICISAPLPTIRDGQDWGKIANFRKGIKATHRQRTDLTIQFNKRIQEFCQKSGFFYLALDEESLGRNGLVRDDLINSNPNDHHYGREVYAKMIIAQFKATSLFPQSHPPNHELYS